VSLPPPPILGWSGIPPVWRRWFQGLFTRVGGTSGRLVVIEDDGSDATALGEIEERLAAIPERPDVSTLGARLADLEGQLAGLAAPNLSDILSRLAALEVEAASLATPSRAEPAQAGSDAGPKGAPGDDGHSPVLTWSGDQIAIDAVVSGPHLTGPAGGGSANAGTATVDFGAAPGGNSAEVVVTGQAAIVSNSFVEAWFMAATSADHNAEEHALAPALAALSCGAIIAGTGFTIYARSTVTLTGVWTVSWTWS
jgi:hypothetical protein